MPIKLTNDSSYDFTDISSEECRTCKRTDDTTKTIEADWIALRWKGSPNFVK